MIDVRAASPSNGVAASARLSRSCTGPWWPIDMCRPVVRLVAFADGSLACSRPRRRAESWPLLAGKREKKDDVRARRRERHTYRERSVRIIRGNEAKRTCSASVGRDACAKKDDIDSHQTKGRKIRQAKRNPKMTFANGTAYAYGQQQQILIRREKQKRRDRRRRRRRRGEGYRKSPTTCNRKRC